MICQIRKTDPAHPAPNILACIRQKGQWVRLHLPGGGVLEITVDEIRSEGVGLVFAVSSPLVFEDMGKERE